MPRTCSHPLAAALAALGLLAPTLARGDEAAELDAGIATYLDMARRPGGGRPEGCAGLDALVARHPDVPVYLAYAGACALVAARDAAEPERQGSLAEQGLERVQRALAMLGPAHDAAELRGVPVSVETRLAAAELYASLPKLFRLGEAARTVAAAAKASPAWARTPEPIRARLERVAAPEAPAQPRPAEAPPLDPAVVTAVTASAADDFRTLPLPGGCTLINNPWNRGASETDVTPFEDVFRGTGPAGDLFGWRWRWSERNPMVVAYPEVSCGTKPWDLGEAPVPEGGPFPFRAGAKKVTVGWDAAMAATGSWNLAFELWAVTDLAHPRRSISHEVMIWTAHGGALRPAGARVGELTVGGVRFGAWLRKDHGDASGGASNRWTYLAFVAEEPILRGALDLSEFLAWTARQGLIDERAWITGVELGNEVVGGTGTTVLRSFSVEVR